MQATFDRSFSFSLCHVIFPNRKEEDPALAILKTKKAPYRLVCDEPISEEQQDNSVVAMHPDKVDAATANPLKEGEREMRDERRGREGHEGDDEGKEGNEGDEEGREGNEGDEEGIEGNEGDEEGIEGNEGDEEGIEGNEGDEGIFK